MNRLDELIKEYTQVFNENFPLFAIPSAPESEIVKIIENCLEENTPYTPEYKKDAKY